MIEGLSIPQMAREAHKVFHLALEEFGLPILEEASFTPGWINVGEYFGSLEEDIRLRDAAQEATTRYLLGAGLPPDYTLADPVFSRAWQAVAIHLHGLVAAEPDEHDSVIDHTAAWIERHQHERVSV